MVLGSFGFALPGVLAAAGAVLGVAGAVLGVAGAALGVAGAVLGVAAGGCTSSTAECGFDTQCPDRLICSFEGLCVEPGSEATSGPGSGGGTASGTGGGTSSSTGPGGGHQCDPSQCPVPTAACEVAACNEMGNCGVADAPRGTPCFESGGNGCDEGVCIPFDDWVPLSTDGAPSARFGHTSIYAGSEMLVWGGASDDDEGFLGDGYRYAPATNTWTPMSMTGAPSARRGHAAVWTGNRMLIWGGVGDGGHASNGGIYDPSTDSWTTITTAGAPSARAHHTMVWSGTVAIVFGGEANGASQAGGARFDPGANLWLPVSGVGQPSARNAHAAVWTGAQMLIWGGEQNGQPLGDGGIYQPGTNTWLSTSNDGALPQPRVGLSATFTSANPKAGLMLLFGGHDGTTTRADNHMFDHDFQPGGWWYFALPAGQPPSPRAFASTAWTENSGMFVWGGCADSACTSYLDDGGHWVNLGGSGGHWYPVPPSAVLSGRTRHTAVWTGQEAIVWGGRNDAGALGDGARRWLFTDD